MKKQSGKTNRIKQFFSNFRKDESGATMIIVAVGLVAFLSIASLVTDLGLRYYQKSNIQNACDAAALAAVTYLPDQNRARQVAYEYLEKNGFTAEGVVIEFPEEYVVRVRKTQTISTLFATVFDDDTMTISCKAAAIYVDKNLSIDFDYLMFYGDTSTFHLMGDFREVAGSVFANGNISVETNDAAIIYDIVSHGTVTYSNNMSTRPNTQNNAAYQAMPDWDEMIMSICPSGSESAFFVTHDTVSPTRSFAYNMTGDRSIGATNYRNGSMYCSGSLSTGYSGTYLVVNGDLYVGGDFRPACPVWVKGSIYVGGTYYNQWGMSLKCDGSMYVGNNCSFLGNTDIADELYVGGHLNIVNSSATYNFKTVYVMGDVSSVTAWGAKVNVRGNLFVYGALALGGGGTNTITGNIYVWGNGYNSGDQTCFLNGRLILTGNVYNKHGGVGFGGNGDCTIIGFIYSGDTITTYSGGDISLNGCMIAEGDIKVGGASHTYNDSGATLSLYSRQGNIVLGSQGTALKMWGIVYAPQGDIKIATNGLTINGSLVANTITCNIGSGFYLGRNDRTLPFAKTVRAAALIE